MAMTGIPAAFGRRDGRLDAVDVDGDENDAVDLLGDVILHRVVLGAWNIVGVEDNEFGASSVRGLLRAFVDLIEEQRLLIDRHERERIGEGGRADSKCDGDGCSAAGE